MGYAQLDEDRDPASVEVATTGGVVRVRDSKDADGDRLRFSADAWVAFLADAVERGGSPGC